MSVAIAKASELGTNCWLPARFCGGACPRLESCKYLEKRTCRSYLLKSATNIIFAPGAGGMDYQI